MTEIRLDDGSFRDRDGRIFYRGGKVHRALSEAGAEAWRELSSREFFHRLISQGKIVGTRESELPQARLQELSPRWVRALEHDRIPFLSYPYEWSFNMLRDAALLQLDLLLEALREGMTLKDASAYNVQWQGTRPVFIDVASFEVWKEGDPWVGYLQFCQLFLYPLLLTAYRDIPFNPWLRGAVDGITPEECNSILSWRDRFRPGVLTHVFLHAKLQGRTADSDANVRSEIQRAGFKKELIVHNVGSLRKLVGKLAWRRSGSQWSAYAEDNSYDSADHEVKERFVTKAAAHRRWKLVWDLGCNTGTFSRLAAKHGDYVVAVDGDALAVDRLYLALKAEGCKNILPMVSNLADASPAIGWRHRERKALLEREKPDLTLCLALIHHMVITANIPLPEFVDFLADLGSHLIIEFVSKDDPMVQKLLRNKPDIYHDYELDVFEACLQRRFAILERETCHSGTRRLYFAEPRP